MGEVKITTPIDVEMNLDTSAAEKKIAGLANDAERIGNVLKPSAGYKTTEFWVTLATMAIAILVAAGIMSPADAEQLKGQANETTELIVKLVAALAPVVYIISRAVVKVRNRGN